MKALVLNVDKHTLRMNFQAEQLKRLGIECERIAARTPDNITPEANDPYWNNWERPLKTVEKAILLTHQEAWEKVIAANMPMLILEDDAWLSKNTKEFLDEIAQTKNIEHVSLEIRGRKKLIARKSHQTVGGLRRLYQDRSGAAAYVLWPAGAKKLLARSHKNAGLADAMICAAYEMSSWQAVPPMALQLDKCETYGLEQPLNTTSAVTDDRQATSEIITKTLSHTFRRLSAQIKMGLRRILTLHKAERVYLTPNRSDFTKI